MKAWKIIGYILLIVGGLNWGLIGFFNYNLVDTLFGVGSGVSRTIYALVGIAALIIIIAMMFMPMMMSDDDQSMKSIKK